MTIHTELLKRLQDLAVELDESTYRMMDYTERSAREKTKFLQHVYSEKAQKYQEKAQLALAKMEEPAMIQIREKLDENVLGEIQAKLTRASTRLSIYQAKVHPQICKLEGDLRYVFHAGDIQRLRQDYSQLRALLPQPNQPTQKRMVEFEQSLIAREKWLLDPKNSERVAKDLKEMKSGLLQQIRSIRSLVNQADGAMKDDVSSVLKLQQTRFEKLDQIPMAQIVQAISAN